MGRKVMGSELGAAHTFRLINEEQGIPWLWRPP